LTAAAVEVSAAWKLVHRERMPGTWLLACVRLGTLLESVLREGGRARLLEQRATGLAVRPLWLRATSKKQNGWGAGPGRDVRSRGMATIAPYAAAESGSGWRFGGCVAVR
jgi:hypothetical protein